MTVDIEELEKLLLQPEGERLEFKTAERDFSYDSLAKYCCALANEGGGQIILGVTDKRPRKITGTQAFPNPGETAASLCEHLHHRISAHEVTLPAGERALIFRASPRHLGMPVAYRGIYYSRKGDALVPLTPQELHKVFEENTPDYSAQIHATATLAELDGTLIERFRQMWMLKSGNGSHQNSSHHQLLEDAELLYEGGITNAALILLGTPRALGLHIAQAEVIFEYRNTEASTAYQYREEFRCGFLGILDSLWKLIHSRNEVVQYREGLFVYDIPVFNEGVVREALLNALAHRDYRLAGSIFVKQYPRKLEIISPGGFPAGINAANILRRQEPRNRRIAEACAKCGLVERSGQGADLMFQQSIKEGKAPPDFTGTDDYQVSVTLQGDVQNPKFLGFLQKVGEERLARFTIDDLLLLHSIGQEQPLPDLTKYRLPYLIQQGIVEKVGRGRGTRYIFSHRFYSHLGETGTYTRRKGLDRETNKALLLQHIQKQGASGDTMSEFVRVLPSMSKRQIASLLDALRKEGKIVSQGKTRGARWVLFRE